MSLYCTEVVKMQNYEKETFCYVLMARDLVLPSLKERVYNDRRPRDLRLTIRIVLGKDLPSPQSVAQLPGPLGRKLCNKRPSKLIRLTRYNYCVCKKPICLQLVSLVFISCL